MTPHAKNLSSRFAWQKRLYALAALLLVMSAHACPPEVDKAVAQLQESARAEISADDWLVQIVDKTGEFFDWSALQSDGKAAPRKNLRTTLFPDKRTLVYLRKYLAESKFVKAIGKRACVPSENFYSAE
ncbi:MAG: hypothetical protein LBQ75_00020 [Zoogloeaceae bacterium]|jgi:hypothetical protein|nr:hypothetical protein [Zoogloeaceae bacterium]